MPRLPCWFPPPLLLSRSYYSALTRPKDKGNHSPAESVLQQRAIRLRGGSRDVDNLELIWHQPEPLWGDAERLRQRPKRAERWRSRRRPGTQEQLLLMPRFVGRRRRPPWIARWGRQDPGNGQEQPDQFHAPHHPPVNSAAETDNRTLRVAVPDFSEAGPPGNSQPRLLPSSRDGGKAAAAARQRNAPPGKTLSCYTLDEEPDSIGRQQKRRVRLLGRSGQEERRQSSAMDPSPSHWPFALRCGSYGFVSLGFLRRLETVKCNTRKIAETNSVDSSLFTILFLEINLYFSLLLLMVTVTQLFSSWTISWSSIPFIQAQTLLYKNNLRNTSLTNSTTNNNSG